MSYRLLVPKALRERFGTFGLPRSILVRLVAKLLEDVPRYAGNEAFFRARRWPGLAGSFQCNVVLAREGHRPVHFRVVAVRDEAARTVTLAYLIPIRL